MDSHYRAKRNGPNMNTPETSAKRRIGRPPTGVVNPVVVASRVSPETAQALARESERRGVKPAAAIREAIEAMFNPMINRAA
jgi:hypothetical protein